MIYPNLKQKYSENELKKLFLLSKNEKELMEKVKNNNKLGFIIILKSYQHLHYIPTLKKKFHKC